MLAVLVAVFGYAASSWSATFLALVSELSGRRAAGVASAVGVTANNLGSLAVPPLFGALVDLTHSYSIGWGPVAVLAAVAAVSILPVHEGDSDEEPAAVGRADAPGA